MERVKNRRVWKEREMQEKPANSHSPSSRVAAVWAALFFASVTVNPLAACLRWRQCLSPRRLATKAHRVNIFWGHTA